VVAPNTVLTIDVQGQTGGWLPTDDTALRAGVLNMLTPYFDIIGATITRGSMLANVLDFQWYHWNYSAVLTLKTRVGYASADDVRGIVAHAFYAAGGAMPSVSVRNVGESQGPGINQEGLGLGGLLAGSTFVVVAALAALIYVIAYAPNVGSVARAVRP